MKIVDNDGRLFGLVNVIDLLVILLAIAVVTAGLSLSGIGSTSQSDVSNSKPDSSESAEDTRYATIEVSSQPDYLADLVVTNQTVTIRGQNATIVDIYRTPINAEVGLTLRVQLNTTNEFQFANESILLGNQLTVASESYQITGTVTELSKTKKSLPVSNHTFALRAEVPPAVADVVSVGNRHIINGKTVANIESVSTENHSSVSSGNESIVVEITLWTIRRNGTRYYARHPVRLGTTVSFQTPQYSLSGQIISIQKTSSTSNLSDADQVQRRSATSIEK